MAYMDVPPVGPPNGRTVVLFHGINFAGFYFGGPIDALRKEGFRVVVPDQIGFGRSSKPIIPYNFHDMARNTRLLLQHLKIDKAADRRALDGRHAGRAVRDAVSRRDRAAVIYNPIGLLDARFERPWGSVDEAYKRALGRHLPADSRRHLQRYFSHNPAAWNPEFEKYPRIRYAWTLSADWPRSRWCRRSSAGHLPGSGRRRLGAHQGADAAFGGAEDVLPGSAAGVSTAHEIKSPNAFRRVADGCTSIPVSDTSHTLSRPNKTLPPLVALSLIKVVADQSSQRFRVPRYTASASTAAR